MTCDLCTIDSGIYCDLPTTLGCVHAVCAVCAAKHGIAPNLPQRKKSPARDWLEDRPCRQLEIWPSGQT